MSWSCRIILYAHPLVSSTMFVLNVFEITNNAKNA